MSLDAVRKLESLSFKFGGWLVLRMVYAHAALSNSKFDGLSSSHLKLAEV